jgi:hypothetical protein
LTKEQVILLSNLEACRQRTEKLIYSMAKTAHLFPVTLEQLTAFSDDQEESIDAFILRYSQCVTMIQEQLFRGIAFLEQEDISDKSNRDKTLLMEKLGAIKSAEAFGTAAMLRNKFSHNYPEDSALRIERLNLIVEEAKFVVASFAEVNSYLHRKGFAS